MTSIVTPMCYTCSRLRLGMTCDAFPSGIPMPIQLSEADHRVPYPGDNDIQYEHNPDTPEFDFSIFDLSERLSIPP